MVNVKRKLHVATIYFNLLQVKSWLIEILCFILLISKEICSNKYNV